MGAPRIDKIESRASGNVIINGNLDFWQRGNTFAAIANGAYSADRLLYTKVGTMVHTLSRSTDVPTQLQSLMQSVYSALLTPTTAQGSLGAGDYNEIAYRVEGYDLAQVFGKNVTLSFWIKAFKTGTYCVSFRNNGGTRSYVKEYTINASNAWEKKTLTFPLNESTGTWDFANGLGVTIGFTIASGVTNQTTPNTWFSGFKVATTNQVNGVDSTSNTLQVSQLMLNEGDIAYSFVRCGKSIQRELALCQRYYEKSYDLDVYPGNTDFNGSESGATPSVTGGGDRVSGPRFKSPKRAIPSMQNYNPQSGTAAAMYSVPDGANKSTTGYVGVGMNGVAQIGATGNTLTINFTYLYQWTAESEL